MNANGPSPVLREVVMRGQVALARPQAPRTPAPVAEDAATRIDADLVAVSIAVQTVEEARRRAHEEGLARGSEEAQRLAELAQEQAERELHARTEHLTQQLQRQAEAAYQARARVLEDLIAALPRQIEARLAAAEDDMLALCFEAVCRILGEQAIRPEILRSQLASVIEGLGGRKLVAVHLHPEDLAALKRDQGSRAVHTEGSDIEWIASAEVTLGGCILQSPEGGLDARLETQLQVLRHLLQQGRAAARTSHEHTDGL